MTQGFDIDELERALARSMAEPEDLEDQGFWTEARVIAIFPAILTEIRELRAENARLRHNALALDQDLKECMPTDKFFTDLAALTGCFRVDGMFWPHIRGEEFEIQLWTSDGPKSGTGSTVEAAMQEVLAALGEPQ